LPTLLFNYPSMDAIVGHLCEQFEAATEGLVVVASEAQFVEERFGGVFSVYLCAREARKGRVILFPAMGQQPSFWHSFAQVLTQANFDVYVVHLPG
jgi:predicted alpha/beta hydrolase